MKGDTSRAINFLRDGNLVMEIRDSDSRADTTVYDGSKIVKFVTVDRKADFKLMELHKYDEKGNEIEELRFK